MNDILTMERIDRVSRLNAVQREGVASFWAENGFPYTERQHLTSDRTAAVLQANGPDEERIAGQACMEALQGRDEIQLQSGDPVEVCRILRELLQFEEAQIAVEDAIISELDTIDQMWAHLHRTDEFEGVPVAITNAQLDIIAGIDPFTAIVTRLAAAHELFNEHVINRWKFLCINVTDAAEWVWPNCAILGNWLQCLVGYALQLYGEATAEEATGVCSHSIAALDALLLRIFNDTFLVNRHCPRFVLYRRKEEADRAAASVPVFEFQHLLHELFAAEKTPSLNLVKREQLPGIEWAAKGATFRSELRNNVGDLSWELGGVGAVVAPIAGSQLQQGSRKLVIKFEGVKIVGNPNGAKGLHADKFLLCEIHAHVQGWRIVKLSALSLPIMIGSNQNQIRADPARHRGLAAVQFADADFRFGRNLGEAAPQALSQRAVLQALNRLKMARMQRPLTRFNLECLGQALKSVCPGDGTVTLEQFVAPIPDTQNLSFSEFFYGFLELGMAHFQALWIHGLVLGWLSREHVQSLLQDRPVGTFLLCAPLSMKGLKMSWKHTDQLVHPLEPWSDQELQTTGLVQRILLIAPNCSGARLTHIYPQHEISILERVSPPAPPPPPPTQNGPVTRIPYAKVLLQPVVVLPDVAQGQGGANGHA